jgi:glyceraldehyde 3-phosphate dehydrogenase
MATVGPFFKSARKLRVGINGFGRIGRILFRVLEQRKDEFEVVAVNDLTNDPTIEYLLEYDTTFGRFPGRIEAGAPSGEFLCDGRRVAVFSERDPAALRWADYGVEVVVDSTGVFRNAELLRPHIEQGGARRVVLSAPAKGGAIDATVVMGVNHTELTSEHHIVSNASCTTNCLAPVAKLLHDSFGGIVRGFMTTVHAYTNDQRILDLPHRDLRRARGAANNIIPTTTGAASAVGLVLPALAGKLDGLSMRVPVPDGSIIDLTVEVGEETTAAEVNEVFREAAQGAYENVLAFTQQPIVSSDIIGDPHSATIDGLSTAVMDGRLLKVLAWYDNEWGYSNRLADLVAYVSSLSD